MISIPFSGSKRNRYKEVKQIVQDHGYKKIYEAFGGSAVLSVNLFREGIVERAVINDYDRLFDLYPAYLDIKDNLIKKCLEAGFIKSNKRLNDTQREYLQSMIATIDEKVLASIGQQLCLFRKTDWYPEDFGLHLFS